MTEPYDCNNPRWAHKGSLRRWSNYVAGRIATQQALIRDREVVVSCYDTFRSGRFFTDPVLKDSRPTSRVVYRVRVKLKEGVCPCAQP